MCSLSSWGQQSGIDVYVDVFRSTYMLICVYTRVYMTLYEYVKCFEKKTKTNDKNSIAETL